MKVQYPSRECRAYHCKPLKVRTAYPTWYGCHLRGCKPICMNVGRTDQNEAEAVALRSFRRAQRKETRPTYSYRNVLLLTLRRCAVA